MEKKPSPALIKAVAATAELCGRTFTEPAARQFVADLADYPEALVLGALKRCRLEVRGVLTVSDVIARLDDGRPGPEEAFAMLPRGEAQTAVMTDEMADAWGLVRDMLEDGDEVAARLAFKERYALLLTKARAEKTPIHWFATIGQDVNGREAPLRDAVAKGRLTAAHVSGLLPAPATNTPLLEAAKGTGMPQHIREMLKLPAKSCQPKETT